MKTNGMLYTVIFSFLAAFLFVFFLALAHGITREKVALNEKLAEQKAVLQAADIAFTDNATVVALYNERVTQGADAENFYTISGAEGQTLYAEIFSGPGLWGTITGIIAVDARLTRIAGIAIVSHNETPGLGGKIDEAYFKEQFRSEQLGSSRTITVGAGGPGDTDHSNSRVDGITGATRTSELFAILINHSLRELAVKIAAIGGSK